MDKTPGYITRKLIDKSESATLRNDYIITIPVIANKGDLNITTVDRQQFLKKYTTGEVTRDTHPSILTALKLLEQGTIDTVRVENFSGTTGVTDHNNIVYFDHNDNLIHHYTKISNKTGRLPQTDLAIKFSDDDKMYYMGDSASITLTAGTTVKITAGETLGLTLASGILKKENAITNSKPFTFAGNNLYTEATLVDYGFNTFEHSKITTKFKSIDTTSTGFEVSVADVSTPYLYSKSVIQNEGVFYHAKSTPKNAFVGSYRINPNMAVEIYDQPMNDQVNVTNVGFMISYVSVIMDAINSTYPILLNSKLIGRLKVATDIGNNSVTINNVVFGSKLSRFCEFDSGTGYINFSTNIEKLTSCWLEVDVTDTIPKKFLYYYGSSNEITNKINNTNYTNTIKLKTLTSTSNAITLTEFLYQLGLNWGREIVSGADIRYHYTSTPNSPSDRYPSAGEWFRFTKFELNLPSRYFPVFKIIDDNLNSIHLSTETEVKSIYKYTISDANYLEKFSKVFFEYAGFRYHINDPSNARGTKAVQNISLGTQPVSNEKFFELLENALSAKYEILKLDNGFLLVDTTTDSINYSPFLNLDIDESNDSILGKFRFIIKTNYTADNSVFKISYDLDSDDNEIIIMKFQELPNEELTIKFSLNSQKVDENDISLFYENVNNKYTAFTIKDVNPSVKYAESLPQVSIGNELFRTLVTEDDIKNAYDKFKERETLPDVIFSGHENKIGILSHVANLARELFALNPVSIPASVKNIPDIKEYAKNIAGDNNFVHVTGNNYLDTTLGDFAVELSGALKYINNIFSNRATGDEFRTILGKTAVFNSIPLNPQKPSIINELLNNNINSIAYDGLNYYFSDSRTLNAKKSYLREESTTRIVVAIHRTLEQSIADFVIGRPNNSETRDLVKTLCTNLLNRRRIAGGNSPLQSFNVICDATNNTQEMIDNNYIAVGVEGSFTGVIKYVELTTIVKKMTQ